MPRINPPSSIEASPAASRPLLEGVNKMLGSVPNLFRTVGVSPAALEGFLGLFGAMNKSAIDGRTRERLAMVVAENNGCSYCLSAHTYLGKNLARLDDAELTANRDARSNDPKADAALKFARRIVQERGHVSAADVEAARTAGFTDAQLIDIVCIVALNTLTNYVNEVAKTDIDFPVVDAGRKAA